MLADTTNLNLKAKANNTYDAIVVGSGISGGWAAKELSERGLKTLMLERGRNFEHIKDYKTANNNPWDFRHRGNVTLEQRKQRPVISRNWGAVEQVMDYWTDEQASPYTEIKPFNWCGHTNWVAVRYYGDGKVTAGAILTLKLTRKTAGR